MLVIASLTLLPALFLFYRNFIYTRRGWHMQSIQYEAIYWIVRTILCPLLVWLMIRYWEELGNLLSLIRKQVLFFIGYLFVSWSISCVLAANLASDFDGRLHNLIDTVKNDSFTLSILVYTLTVFVVYLWTYFEKENERRPAALNLAAEKPQRKAPGVLIVKNGYKTIPLPIEEIACLLAAGPYVRAVTADGSVHLVGKRLYKLESELPGNFLRVHRSHIVNENFIKEVRSLLNGDYVLVLKNGTTVRSSRTFRRNLRAFL